MTGERTTEWDYEFSVWPAEHGWGPAVYELFEFFKHRVVLTKTEGDWNEFREGLARYGLVCHEVSRVTHYKPETVL